MFECLILIGLIIFFGAFVAFLLKLLIALVLLPIRLGFWLLKGLFALVLIVPILVISLGAVSAVVPLVLAVLALPVLIVVGGAILLARLFA